MLKYKFKYRLGKLPKLYDKCTVHADVDEDADSSKTICLPCPAGGGDIIYLVI